MFVRNIAEQEDIWAGKSWAFMTFLLFKAFWIAYMMPLFAVALTDMASLNRLYGLYAGASAWIMSLVGRHLAVGLHDGNVFTAMPFGGTDQGTSENHGHIDLLVLDGVMTGCFVMSAYAVVFNSSGAFDGFTSELHVPLTHRWRMLIIASAYWLITGICEMAFVFSSQTMNQSAESSDWIWPPDDTDCNKPFALAYAACKPILAVYVMAVLVGQRWSSRLTTIDARVDQKPTAPGCQSPETSSSRKSNLISPRHPQMKNSRKQASSKSAADSNLGSDVGVHTLSKHHHQMTQKFVFTCKLVALGTVCCWFAEISFALLEQSYGVRYHTMAALVHNNSVSLYDLGNDPCHLHNWAHQEEFFQNATELVIEPIDSLYYLTPCMQVTDCVERGYITEQFENVGRVNRAYWRAQSVVMFQLNCTLHPSDAACVYTRILEADYSDLPNMICMNSSWHLTECASESMPSERAV